MSVRSPAGGPAHDYAESMADAATAGHERRADSGADVARRSAFGGPRAWAIRRIRWARAAARRILLGVTPIWQIAVGGPRGSLLSLAVGLALALLLLRQIGDQSRSITTEVTTPAGRRAAVPASAAAPARTARPPVAVVVASPTPFVPRTFATFAEASGAYGFALWEPHTLPAGVRLLALTTTVDGYPAGHPLPVKVLRASYGVGEDAPLFTLEQGWGVAATSVSAPEERTGRLSLTFGAGAWTRGHMSVACDAEVNPLCVTAWEGDELVLGSTSSGTEFGWRLISEKQSFAELSAIAEGVLPRQHASPGEAVVEVLYLVDSEEQAQRLRAAINSIDPQLGFPSRQPAVIVVTSEAEEDQARRSLDDLANLRAVLGLPPAHLIDLRRR